MTSNFSPDNYMNLCGRTVDSRPQIKSSSVPPTAKYIQTSDDQKFPDSARGREGASRHQKFLDFTSSPSSAKPPADPLPRNLFGSADAPGESDSAAQSECEAREEALRKQADQIALDRAEISAMREDLKLQASNLDSLVQKLVHDALSKFSGLGAEDNNMDVVSDAGAPRPDLKTDLELDADVIDLVLFWLFDMVMFVFLYS